jgi:hypothetical protein
MKNPENLHRTPQKLELLRIKDFFFKSGEKLTNLSTAETCPQGKIVLAPTIPLWTGFTVFVFFEFNKFTIYERLPIFARITQLFARKVRFQKINVLASKSLIYYFNQF